MKSPYTILVPALLVILALGYWIGRAMSADHTPVTLQQAPAQQVIDQQNTPPPIIKDSVILEVTTWQEAKVNSISQQKLLLDQQQEVLFEAILDMNGLTRAQVQGKRVVTKKKKD